LNKSLSKLSFLKIFLIALSILIWGYFLVASNVSLEALIIFDLPTIANTFFTFNFLFFLIFFPITSSICIALSTGKKRNIDILEVSIGIVIGILLTSLIFGLKEYFLIFGFLYLLAHIVLSILTYNKFKERKKLNILSNYANSKIALLLTFVLAIMAIIIILPTQEDYALYMQAGMVNMFVGDDVSNWLGTSYSIGRLGTQSTIDFIVDTEQYINLRDVKDPNVYKFTNFIDDFKSDLDSKKTTEDIMKAQPNLTNEKLKNNLLSTFKSMPIMIVVQEYFAIIFAIIFASFAQLYFSIAFSLFGLLFVYLFYKLFTTKKEEPKKEEEVKISKDIEITENINGIEDSFNIDQKENLDNIDLKENLDNIDLKEDLEENEKNY